MRPIDFVIAIQAINTVTAVVVAAEIVVTGIPVGDNTGFDGRFIPGNTVTERELLDLVAGIDVIEIVADGQLIAGTVLDHQVTVLTLQRNQRGGSDIGKPHHIGIACGGVALFDPVHPSTDGEPIRIVTGAAVEHVITATTIQRVCTVTAAEHIVPCATKQSVVPSIADQRVMTMSTVQDVGQCAP